MTPLRKLQLLIDRYSTQGRSAEALPHVSLLRSESATEAVPVLYRPVLCVVAQGRRRVVLGEKRFDYDAGFYLLASADLPVRAAILEGDPLVPFLSFGLLLEAEPVASLLAEMHGSDPLSDALPTEAMATFPVEKEMLEAVVRLLRLLEHPRDIPVLAPLIEREILYYLLRGPQGMMLRQWVGEGTRSHQISKVITWIRRNYRKSFHIDALTKIANMSAASLHRHFKEMTHMTPLQFQKELRLQEARRLLIEHADDAATIGFSVGYGSSTQFSREYKRHFGAPPVRDASRLAGKGAEPAAF